MAIGYSKTTPSKVYQLDWFGDFKRFKLLQQDHPFYCRFLLDHVDDLRLGFLDRLTLHDYLVKNGRQLTEILPADWRTIHPKFEAENSPRKLRQWASNVLPSLEDYESDSLKSESAVAVASVTILRQLDIIDDFLLIYQKELKEISRKFKKQCKETDPQ